jgi:hypothetical protein
MKSINVLILGREDLINPVSKVTSKLKPSELKSFVPDTMRTIAKESMVIFIDDNGETKILKNRYGDEGKVIRKRRIGFPRPAKKVKIVGVVASNIQDFQLWREAHVHKLSGIKNKNGINTREYTYRNKRYLCLTRPNNCYGYRFDELQETEKAYLNADYQKIFENARVGFKSSIDMDSLTSKQITEIFRNAGKE